MDVAEAFRDLPGLALLESARAGRRSRWTYLSADPVRTITLDAPVADPFAEARAAVRRLGRSSTDTAIGEPPFAGGLIGYLGYDLGLSFESRRTIAADDQGLVLLRLGLHDWVVAWDRLSGRAFLAGRAVDGNEAAASGSITSEFGSKTGRSAPLPNSGRASRSPGRVMRNCSSARASIGSRSNEVSSRFVRKSLPARSIR